jgi:mannosyltransferase
MARRAKQIETAEPAPLPRIVVLATLGGILLLAIALRAAAIGSRAVWIDEANSFVISDRPLADIVRRLADDSSPPLYYFLLHVWAGAFGSSEAALRLLSALFGVGLVAAIWAAGRALLDERTALLAAFFAAISPVAILYSQEIRMYSLLPLLALGAMTFTWRTAKRGGAWNAAGMIGFTIATLYTHNWALFLLPAEALVVILAGALRERARLWVVAAFVVALAYAPWAPVFLKQLHNDGQYAWLFRYWRDLGAFRMFIQSATGFAFRGGGFAHVGCRWSELDVLPAIVALTLVALAPWRLFARGGASAVWMLVGWFVVPLVAALAASSILTPCYVPGRCDQLVYPAFLLLLAFGIGFAKSRAVKAALVTFFVGAAALTLSEYYRTDPKAGDREYSNAVLSSAKPHEPVICTSLTRASLEYYSRHRGEPLVLVSYPRDTAEHLGNQNNIELRTARRDYLVAEARAVVDDVVARAGTGGTFLVLAATTQVNHELRQCLEDRIKKKELTAETIGDYQQSLVRDPVKLLRLTVVASSGDPPRESTR